MHEFSIVLKAGAFLSRRISRLKAAPRPFDKGAAPTSFNPMKEDIMRFKHHLTSLVLLAGAIAFGSVANAADHDGATQPPAASAHKNANSDTTDHQANGGVGNPDAPGLKNANEVHEAIGNTVEVPRKHSASPSS